ncbi:hypothetical protein B9479_004951 [Cryptococcus floricola]|uniref:Helitron helicase-like domain-containing protein n=1 Tax=Cryptococcus floricola TaxID=2591691 RepID=A0A5D3AW17_9TREE|nr:hypothetical protein B9479_004951 [Cryptococcus floricola]
MPKHARKPIKPLLTTVPYVKPRKSSGAGRPRKNIDPATPLIPMPKHAHKSIEPLPTTPLALRSHQDGVVAQYSLGPCDYKCDKCGALHWAAERPADDQHSTEHEAAFSACCSKGNVILPTPLEPPPFLKTLWTANTLEAKEFRKQVRNYNGAMAMASMNFKKQDKSVYGAKGVYTFSISGRVYHQIGSLLPPPDGNVRWAQIYIADMSPDQRAETRQGIFHNLCQPNVLRNIEEVMFSHNPYVQSILTCKERMDRNNQNNAHLHLHMSQEGHDPRTYNTPTSNDVALIYDNSNDPDHNGRELIWQSRATNSLHRIPELSEHFVPLHFPLLFPFGEPGWHPRIPLSNSHDPLHYSSSVQLVSEMAHDETAAYGTNTAATDPLLPPSHTRDRSHVHHRVPNERSPPRTLPFHPRSCLETEDTRKRKSHGLRRDKYIYNGEDRIAVNVSDEKEHRNEVKEYEDSRYISPVEAAWRSLSFPTRGRFPAVETLAIHLPDEQSVFFKPTDNLHDVLGNERALLTTLTEFFTASAHWPDLLENNTYSDAPQPLTWNPTSRTWKQRERFNNTIGRVRHKPS